MLGPSIRVLFAAPRGSRIAASAVVLAFLAACAQPVAYTDTLPTRDLEPGEEVTAQVLANAGEWRNTGVSVRAGTRYRLRAEGKWRAHPTCNYTGADGAGMYVGICIPWTVGRIMTEHPHQRLLARIGYDGPPFAVGSRHEFVAMRDGMLLLHMNEDDLGTGDNDGTVTATLALAETRPAAVAPALAPPPQSAPPPKAARSAAAFPSVPQIGTFTAVAKRPDDIAVVIGNADYGKLGRDIPDVVPAHADAEGFKRFATQALGIREGNVIELRDATGAQMARVFGTRDNPRGQLYDWIRPGRSRVWVYYAGHGAPAGQGGSAYLVPVDADAARIELNGYPLDTLYANLAQLQAQSVTVVLEACFSGMSQSGTVLARSSGIYVRPRIPEVPPGMTVIAAGAADQIASWEEDDSHGLFTKYFLKGMNGEADARPYGNGDGIVAWSELGTYLEDTLTYFARRYYGRDQTSQITLGRPM